MAALGTIRKRGVTLIVIIGLGLFAFIAEEMFRSCEATNNEKRLRVGEVLGKSLSVQEFQDMIDEYQEVIKMTQGRDNLTESELNQVKDQVWDTYVNNVILENEAEMMQWPFTAESSFYLILNMGLGNNDSGTSWAGPIDDANLPAEMLVDWVKVTSLDD